MSSNREGQKMVAFLVIFLSACAAQVPTHVNEQKMMTRIMTQETVVQNEADLRQIADDWARAGQYPVFVTATYANYAAQNAAQINAQDAARKLQNLGVHNVSATTMKGSENNVIVHMKTLVAGAALSCTKTPETADLDDNYDFRDYRMGCGVDEYMGRQVARTSDLEGRVAGAGYDTSTDAARQSAIVDVYRTGKPNEKLDGLASSDIAEGN